MSEKTNMRIWDAIPKTDPKYTNDANQDGHRSTAISGNYMVKLATEQLGPIGEGWGYKILEERFDNTKPVVLVQGSDSAPPVFMMDGGSIVWEKTHTILVELWHGQRENNFTQYGHTKYQYMTKRGLYADNEYAKKSLTDAMKKCLSLLGVCADVFMGEFDNKEYVETAKLEGDLKRADNKDAAYAEKVAEIREYLKIQANQISLCPTIDSMQKVYTVANGKAQRECPLIGLDPALEMLIVDAAYKTNEQKINNKGK